MGNKRIQYIVKYVNIKNSPLKVDQLSTIDTIRKISSNYGMILEVAGDFVVVSKYNLEPVLFARRM